MAYGVQSDWVREALPKPEILMYPLSTNVIDSAVINASGVTADASGPYKGRRYLVQGTILSKRGDGQYERYTGGTGGSAGTNEVQTATLTNASSGETFTLTYSGQTTDPLAYNASAAAVAAALNALSNIQDGTVTVTGSAGGPYTVTFATGVNEPLMTGTGTGDLTVGVVQTTAGAGQAVAGILYDTVEFADGSDRSDKAVAFLRRGAEFKADAIVDFTTYASAVRTALPTCEFL
jgi:hypothetical protein